MAVAVLVALPGCYAGPPLHARPDDSMPKKVLAASANAPVWLVVGPVMAGLVVLDVAGRMCVGMAEYEASHPQQYQQPNLGLEMDHRLTIPAERMRNCWTTCPTPGNCSTMCE